MPYELGSYMFGEFCTTIGGVVIGAAIVGLCWAAEAGRNYRRESQRMRDAEAAKIEAETELLQRVIDREIRAAREPAK